MAKEHIWLVIVILMVSEEKRIIIRAIQYGVNNRMFMLVIIIEEIKKVN